MRLIQSSPLRNPCREVQTLASRVYRSEEVIPVEILERWWQAHPQLFWLAYEAESLCGYTSALPLTQDAFAKTLRPEFDEKEILLKDILRFEKPASYQVYFSSIVVHPNWRAKGVSSILRQAFLKELLTLYDENKQTTALSSRVVSEKGGKMMRSLGMRFQARAAGGEVYYGEQSRETLLNALLALS